MSMAHSGEAPVVDISQKEQKEIIDIYTKLREAEAKLIGPDGKTEILPNNLYSFLLRLLADLRAGHSVTILQNRHRRMYVRDVIAYKSKRDTLRRTTLNDLAKREFAKGDYDQIPDDFHTGE
jgi:hypothetical protein